MVSVLTRYISLATLIRIFIIILIGGALLSYALFQGRHLIEGPVLQISNERYSVKSPTVELMGNARNIVALSINGRPIYTDDAGNWQETLVLPIGYTVVTLRATDRYGRERSLERSYVREPAD